MVGSTSGGRTLPVPTFSHRIDSYSHVVAVGMCGGCKTVGVFMPVLATTIPWRLLMSF